MVSGKRQSQQLARQFFKLSLIDGVVSPERVAGVLAYIDKHRPPRATAILKSYHRLVAGELARSQAVVEHAGALNHGMLDHIASALSTRYGRKIEAAPKRNDALLAGLRVRVGDDVYESSVAGQLTMLATSL